MLIRTQDKTELININNIEKIMIIGKQRIAVQTVGDERWIIIGNYSTKEKVLDVLDVIEMDYAMSCKVCNMPQEDELCLDEVTETERDLADAMNTVNNYKKLLFGGCNDN